jgi:hypothetical protein
MAEAILTLSRELDRANAGQLIAPVSKREAQVRASMAHATITSGGLKCSVTDTASWPQSSF